MDAITLVWQVSVVQLVIIALLVSVELLTKR